MTLRLERMKTVTSCLRRQASRVFVKVTEDTGFQLKTCWNDARNGAVLFNTSCQRMLVSSVFSYSTKDAGSQLKTCWDDAEVGAYEDGSVMPGEAGIQRLIKGYERRSIPAKNMPG